jgi:PiT family inorganic phosphate transporter
LVDVRYRLGLARVHDTDSGVCYIPSVNITWMFLLTISSGALIGVGFASGASVKWGWESGSVSQVAASWAIAPLIAAAFSALIFGTVKYSVLERQDPFLWGMRLIPLYFALTGAILALFIVIEAPTAPSLEEFGAGKAAGIILGVFFGCLLICYVFFVPYFKRKLVHKDARLRIWHVVLGPMLLKDNPPLFFPGKGDEYVTNYYEDAYGEVRAGGGDQNNTLRHRQPAAQHGEDKIEASPSGSLKDRSSNGDGALPSDPEKPTAVAPLKRKRKSEPYERFIGPVQHLSWTNPQKWWGYFKFGLLQGQ